MTLTFVQITGHQWRWFDLSSGKWCSYPAANNAAIDEAYWAGENQVQVVTGRRKYNIIFNTMVQVRRASWCGVMQCGVLIAKSDAIVISCRLML